MTYDQAVTLTTLISAAQGVSFADPAKIQVWFSLLEDLDFTTAHLALKKLLRTEEFNITPAHIRKACVELVEPQVDILGAWQVLNNIIGFGRYCQKEAMEYAEKQNPIICQIVKNIGFINICNSNPEFLRTEFQKLYREAVKSSTQNKMLSDKVKASIGTLRTRLEQEYHNSLALEGDCY